MNDEQLMQKEEPHSLPQQYSPHPESENLYQSQVGGQQQQQPLYYPPHDNNLQQNYQHQPQHGPPTQMNRAPQPNQQSLQQEYARSLVPNDPGRNRMVQPGTLLYSAKMDRSSLKCYYCLQCYWCSEGLLARTVLDVYTQGILVNVPSGKMCCCSRDNGQFVFYDDPMFGRLPTKAGCCEPFPFWCPHGCGCCGEALALKSSGCTSPRWVGHWWCAIALCIPFCTVGCCAADIFAGLADGEADLVASVLQTAMAAARAGTRTIAIPQVIKGQMK